VCCFSAGCGTPNAAANAIDYAKVRSRSLNAVIRIYDEAVNATDDIDGSCTPLNPLELNRTALSDKRSGGREYRMRSSFSTPVK